MKQKAILESRNNKESCTPTARPSSSLVRIDSISINIDAPEQSKSDKCEHFTIRGFVSDIRKKNGKPCWPFAVDDDDASSEDIKSSLPPLHVPKFKWWRCQSCLSEIDAAGATADVENTTGSCSRLLKTKSSQSHRALENVLAHLSRKLEQPLELALDSSTRDLEENELPSAANGYISNETALEDANNQMVALTYLNECPKQSSGPSKPTTSTKFGIVDGAKRRHQDDSSGTGRRKTKKVRMLHELFDKDGKGAQPTVAEADHADEAAKVSSGAPPSLRQLQLNHVRCQKGQKRNKKFQEQDSKCSHMNNVDSLGGKGERRKVQDINGAFVNGEVHMTSKEGHTDAIIKQADKMLFGSKRGADGHRNYHDRGHKKNSDSFSRQENMSIRQPFHGRVTESELNSILPSSQPKGISTDTVNNMHRDADVISLADNNKELEGKSVPKKLMETIQTGHQNRSFQTVQDEYSTRSNYLFSDGYLDTRQGTKYWVPQTENGNLRNDSVMPYMGESSSASKSLIDKDFWQGTNVNSSNKRANQGPCVGNKKPKLSARTEGGPTVVHHTELLISNSSKKMVGSQQNSETMLHEVRDSMIHEFRTSDDIPMDIVELLAKNQYERHLHEVGDNHYMRQSGFNPKNVVVGNTCIPSRADLNEKSLLAKGQNSEKDSGISNKKSKGNTMQRPFTGNTYSPLLSSQGELCSSVQFPVVGSSKTAGFQSCKYDVNQTTLEHRVSPRSQALYDTWQPASRQSDKIVGAWPMIPPNNPVHKSNVLQGTALLASDVGIGKVSKGSSYVSESGDVNNSSRADFGNKFNDFRAQTSYASRPNGVGSRPQMTSPDPYSNETIPAMHLLSLMGGGVQSSTATNMDASANRKTFDKSFSNDHLAKELSENNFRVGKSGHRIKQPSPCGHHSKVCHSNAACQCSPPVPIFGSFTSLPGNVRNTPVTQPLSQHPDKNFLNRNADGSLLPNENQGFRSYKSGFASAGGVIDQEPLHALELSNQINHMFSPGWSKSGSSGTYSSGHLANYYNFVSQESFEALQRRPGPGACCFNRNPSEFTIPGPGNEYMIGAEDLKLRNRSYPQHIIRPMAVSAFKQQGFTNYTSPNNRP
uniref:Embryonic flower 1-like protein n=1 Tax=Kalanchoe fedtschenkoi TaxID=63787 RepID=A0A7N0V863_KALFE